VLLAEFKKLLVGVDWLLIIKVLSVNFAFSDFINDS